LTYRPTAAFSRAARLRAVLPTVMLCAGMALPLHAAERIETIARVKQSIVVVGTFEPSRSPPFQFRGTGFAVGDGSTIATNLHVLPDASDAKRRETLAILVPGSGIERSLVRGVDRVAVDENTDLAVLRLRGPALPPLRLHDSDTVREGQEVLMTGYPIGAVLGAFAATHRGMIAAITPLAIPQRRAAELDAALVRRLANRPFPVFQLDATAYPGNSGSPIYDPDTGEVFGVVNLVFVKGSKEAALTQPSGITYAMPANYLSALLKSAR
jgi:S1-C subfamily serine protease